MDANHTTPRQHVGKFEWLLVVLSVYVLAALFAESAFTLSASTRDFLQHTDTAICVVFLADFFVRFARSKSKAKFLKWGWIDFVSSIPTLYPLRVGRLVRVARVIRVLRAFRGARVLFAFGYQHRAKSAISVAVLASVLLVTFSSIAVLHFEKEHDANIKTVTDAIWWSVVTMATVGYGDKFPNSTEGRVLAIVLMTAGVGLFGIFSGYVASWMLEPVRHSATAEDSISELKLQLATLTNELRELRAEIQSHAPAD